MEVTAVFDPITLKAFGIFLFVIGILFLLRFSQRHGKSVVQEFKGDDEKWQYPEVIIIVWLIIFPIAAFADIFLHLHGSVQFWASMDTILLFALGGRAYLNHKAGKLDDDG